MAPAAGTVTYHFQSGPIITYRYICQNTPTVACGTRQPLSPLRFERRPGRWKPLPYGRPR
jgi:hypothetical protein